MLTFFDQKKQLAELRQDVDKLRKDFGAIELEWADMFDRMRRMLMKISKRSERLAVSEDAQRREGENGNDSTSTPSTLSPRARLIQEQILARRRSKGGEE